MPEIWGPWTAEEAGMCQRHAGEMGYSSAVLGGWGAASLCWGAGMQQHHAGGMGAALP